MSLILHRSNSDIVYIVYSYYLVALILNVAELSYIQINI